MRTLQELGPKIKRAISGDLAEDTAKVEEEEVVCLILTISLLILLLSLRYKLLSVFVHLDQKQFQTRA